MVESDLRKQERLRSRKRNQFAVWSVLPALVVVVIVGGLFWASVWLVFRPSVLTAETADVPPSVVASAEVMDGAALPDDTARNADVIIADDGDEPVMSDDWAETDRATADAPATARTWVTPGDAPTTAQTVGTPADSDDADDDLAFVDEPEGVRRWAATNDLIAGNEWAMTADPSVSDAVVAEADPYVDGPVFGPLLAEIGDEQGLAEAVAAAGPGYEVIANQAIEMTARSAELTARATELASRAEDLTGRLEGLTAKIEELETRLSATGANLLAAPALVPSPQPLALQQQGQGRGPEVVAARATQTPTPGGGTRAPWVVMPQPEPGSKVAAGSIVLETRARGEAPITQIRLVLDGVPLQVALDRRDDTTWRGRASTKVGPGSHTVAVAVVDGQGRTGSYQWKFAAGS
jgi:hypothetical protein